MGGNGKRDALYAQSHSHSDSRAHARGIRARGIEDHARGCGWRAHGAFNSEEIFISGRGRHELRRAALDARAAHEDL